MITDADIRKFVDQLQFEAELKRRGLPESVIAEARRVAALPTHSAEALQARVIELWKERESMRNIIEGLKIELRDANRRASESTE